MASEKEKCLMNFEKIFLKEQKAIRVVNGEICDSELKNVQCSRKGRGPMATLSPFVVSCLCSNPVMS